MVTDYEFRGSIIHVDKLKSFDLTRNAAQCQSFNSAFASAAEKDLPVRKLKFFNELVIWS